MAGNVQPVESASSRHAANRPATDENALHRAYRAKVNWFHPETLRRLYDFARLKTDAAEQHAVANSLRLPLTPEQLYQRRGATFARLRMEAKLYSLRASATRLTGKHWAALYASSLLPRSRARAHRPLARVPLVVWAWDFFVLRLPCRGLPAPALPLFFALRSATVCQQTDASLVIQCTLPFGVFPCLSGLVWLYDTRSLRGCSIHPLSLRSLGGTGSLHRGDLNERLPEAATSIAAQTGD
jgi:hypothetical protein